VTKLLVDPRNTSALNMNDCKVKEPRTASPLDEQEVPNTIPRTTLTPVEACACSDEDIHSGDFPPESLTYLGLPATWTFGIDDKIYDLRRVRSCEQSLDRRRPSTDSNRSSISLQVRYQEWGSSSDKYCTGFCSFDLGITQ